MGLLISSQINCAHNGIAGECKWLISSAGPALKWPYILHTENILAYTKLLSILRQKKNLIGHLSTKRFYFNSNACNVLPATWSNKRSQQIVNGILVTADRQWTIEMIGAKREGKSSGSPGWRGEEQPACLKAALQQQKILIKPVYSYFFPKIISHFTLLLYYYVIIVHEVHPVIFLYSPFFTKIFKLTRASSG